ncbi:hypothetical protein DFJ73DRAFT_802864 [Zopfochytrium polystomum]|nr:hypothetical protein DFJ73DRAFT_802864 [Zopfochytrium polystomum]
MFLWGRNLASAVDGAAEVGVPWPRLANAAADLPPSPSSSPFSPPALLAAEPIETTVSAGLAVAALLLMIAARLVGACSTAMKSKTCSCATTERKSLIRKWLPLLATSTLLDTFVYGSLVVFIVRAWWRYRFGYSPAYFLAACLYALAEPRSYSVFYQTNPLPRNDTVVSASAISLNKLRERLPDLHRLDAIRLAVNVIVVTLALILALNKVALVGNTSFAASRVAVQVNSTVNYTDYADASSVQPNTLYTRLDQKHGFTLFEGSLSACRIASAAADAAFVVPNSTLHQTTTTLICQTDVPGLFIFLHAWSVVKILFVALAAASFAPMYLPDPTETNPSTRVVAYFTLLLFLLELLVLVAVEAVGSDTPLLLAWCPSSDLRECSVVALGTVKPFAFYQSARWATSLGQFPVDKVLGYGAAVAYYD